MQLFKENGHLTHEGINAIIAESLTELERLEACEHLSFCDICLTKYTNALENAPLLEVPRDFAPAVKTYANNRKLKYIITRVGTVAAGFAIAMTMWTSGVFVNFIPVADYTQNSTKAPSSDTVQSGPITSFFTNIGKSISGAFSSASQAHQKNHIDKAISKNQAMEDQAQASVTPQDEISQTEKLKLEKEQERQALLKKQQEELQAKIGELFEESPAKIDYQQGKDILNNLKNPNKTVGENN